MQKEEDKDQLAHDEGSSETESEEKAKEQEQDKPKSKEEEQDKAGNQEDDEVGKLAMVEATSEEPAQKKSDMSNMVRLWRRGTASDEEKKALEYYEGLQKRQHQFPASFCHVCYC